MPDRQGPPLPAAQSHLATEAAAFLRSLSSLSRSGRTDAEVPDQAAPVAVDTTAWLAWTLAGLHACALPGTGTSTGGEPGRGGPWVPSVRVMIKEARHVAVVIAMHRHGGNLTRAATALGTSRRALRDTLKAAGLYPWGGASEDDASEDHDASAGQEVSSATADAVKGGE